MQAQAGVKMKPSSQHMTVTHKGEQLTLGLRINLVSWFNWPCQLKFINPLTWTIEFLTLVKAANVYLVLSVDMSLGLCCRGYKEVFWPYELTV